MSRRTDIGLADLLLIRKKCSRESFHYWLQQLAPELTPPKPDEETALEEEQDFGQHGQAMGRAGSQIQDSPADDATPVSQEIPFLRLAAAFHKAEQEKPKPRPQHRKHASYQSLGTFYKIEGYDRDGKIQERLPWSVWLPKVQCALQSERPGKRLDFPRLTRRLARAQVLNRLPHRSNRSLARRCLLLLDEGPQLEVLEAEGVQLEAGLKRLLGEHHLDLVRCKEGLKAVLACLQQKAQHFAAEAEPPVIVVLSDLGQLDAEPELASVWLSILCSVRKHRLSLWVMSANLPTPAQFARLPECLRRQTLLLERTQVQAKELEVGCDTILSLVAHCRLLSPGLLRDLCLLLPQSEASLAHELACWRSLQGAQTRGGRRLPAASEAEHRRAFQEEASVALQYEALECLRRWRVGEPIELWYSELLSCAADKPELFDGSYDTQPAWLRQDLDNACAHLADLEQELTGQPGQPLDPLLMSWTEELSEDIGARVTENSFFTAQELARIWFRAHKDQPKTAYPAWIDPAWKPDDLAGEKKQVHPFNLLILASAGEQQALLASNVYYKEMISGLLADPAFFCRDREAVLREQAAEGVLQEELIHLPFSFSGDSDSRYRTLQTASANWNLELRSDLSHLKLDCLYASSIFPHTSKNKRSIRTGFGRDTFGLFMELHICRPVTRLRWIPAGEFWMGSPEDEEGRSDWEGPRHRVRITRGFWLGETPVTQAEYQTLLATNPSRFCDQADSAQRPVERVSWFDTLACCNALSERCGLKAGYALPAKPERADVQKIARVTNGQAFRLPSEAEWEYACRAGSDEPRYGELKEIAWGDHNAENTTHPVAELHPNAWGLYDTLGNVWEWCWDAIEGEEYKRRVEAASSEPVLDPVQDSSASGYRVFRGGSFFFVPGWLRAAYRVWSEPGRSVEFLGFRLCL